jgi:hypothetical protein
MLVSILAAALSAALAAPSPGFPLPIPPINVNDPISLGFTGTLSNLVLESLDFGQSNGFEIDYVEPAKGAGPFTVAIHKLRASIVGDFNIQSIANKSAHAAGNLAVGINDTDLNLTITLAAGKAGLPGAATVKTCSFAFGHNITASAINPNKNSTFSAEERLMLVVTGLTSGDGWSALTDLVNLLVAPAICKKFLKKYVEGNTSSLTSVLKAVNTKLAPLLVPPVPVVVPAAASKGMVNWPEAFKAIKWFPLFLLEEALTFAAPMVNKKLTDLLTKAKLLNNGTVSLSGILGLLHVFLPKLPNPFPIHIGPVKLPIPLVNSLNITIADVAIAGLTDFNYLALMVPLKNQTLMNSFGFGSFGFVVTGQLSVPSIIGRGLTITKDFVVDIKMPNAVLNIGLNVFVKSGYFQAISIEKLLKPLCLLGGWETDKVRMPMYALTLY